LLAEPWLSIFDRLLPDRMATAVKPRGCLQAGLSVKVTGWPRHY